MQSKIVQAVLNILLAVSFFKLFGICGSLEYGSIDVKQAAVQAIIVMVVMLFAILIKYIESVKE